jgi:hypothetical protein
MSADMASSVNSNGPMEKAYNIDDLRIMARKRLPKVNFDYLDGGADDEVMLQRKPRGIFRLFTQ